MDRRTLTRLALILAAMVLVPSLPGVDPVAVAQYEQPGGPRAGAALTILQINDVYSTVPIDGVGGLARVATIRQRVLAAGGHPLLMLAGDFLSTSVASTVFKGEQMIATLNAAGVDMATLGNHEFDFGVDVLLERMAEARWQWVVSNVLDRRTGKPIGGADPYAIRMFGSLKVGVIGLCLTDDPITRDTLERIQLIEPAEAAARYLPVLRSEQVDVIIAITHLSFAEDLALAERFPDIDVIVGGHEHFPITATVGRTLITKAGTEARFVARIDVNRRASGTVERFFELVPVTEAIPDEPRTAAVAASYEARLGAALDVAIGRTGVALDGNGGRLRTSETNLGNFVADGLRASVGADIALVNSGGIRSDRIHAVGPILRRTVLEIHPFGNVVCKIEVTGRALQSALEHGVSRLPAPAGQFLQVSGVTMRVDPREAPGSRVRDVRVQGVALDLERMYTVALPDFLLLGGDGYQMFSGQQVLIGPEAGQRMEVVLEAQIAGKELAPRVEGRIVISP